MSDIGNLIAEANPYRAPVTAPTIKHRMLPGSHEERSGPLCACGHEWDWFSDRCTTGIPVTAPTETEKP